MEAIVGRYRPGAMSVFRAIILGLVQGVSEFLPISSSGHLILTRWVFGWEDLPEDSEKAFDVALHFGTLVAVVAYFRADIAKYFREGFRLVLNREKPATTDGKIAWFLVLATLPAGAVGALFSDQIDSRLGTPTIIAISLIGFGLLLFWSDRQKGTRKVDEFGAKDALFVGAAQALALNPGTSRAGITMTAARQVGFDRDSAARISFLMSLPVIAGAVVFSVGGLILDGVPDGLWTPMIVGVITAAISGWIAVWGTLRLLRTQSFTPFVIYRCVVGVAVLIAVAAGFRS